MADGDEKEVLELDSTQLEAMIDERAEAKAKELLASREEDDRRRDLELDNARKQLRVTAVREKLRALQKDGHAPALLDKVGGYLLADDREEEVLTLSLAGEDGADPTEKKVSVTEIVLDLVSAMPKTSLHVDQPKVSSLLLSREPEAGDDKEDKRTPSERADEALKDLKEGPVLSLG